MCIRDSARADHQIIIFACHCKKILYCANITIFYDTHKFNVQGAAVPKMSSEGCGGLNLNAMGLETKPMRFKHNAIDYSFREISLANFAIVNT